MALQDFECSLILTDPVFSLEHALLEGFSNQKKFEHLNFPPTDAFSQEELEQAYDKFYGTSPLTSPAASCPTSRAASPCPEAVNEDLPGASTTAFISPVNQSQLQHSVLFAHNDHSVLFARNDHPQTSRAGEHRANVPVAQADRSGNSACRRQKEQKKKKRQRERAAEEKAPASQYKPKRAVIKKRVENAQSLAAREYSAAQIPCVKTGYAAERDSKHSVYDLDYLVKKKGFRVIEWDGKTSVPIVDKENRVVAVLAGHPDDDQWDSVAAAAYDALEDGSSRITFTQKIKKHRRGNFPALNYGVSHGMGRPEPSNIGYKEAGYEEVLQSLLDHPSFKRIAGFASATFATWAPKLFAYFATALDEILENDQSLKRNFANSVWAAVAFNFGPCTVTAKHRDCGNIPFGWCCVTALGRFDHKKGGHFVLWEFGLVIEFPSGSTILLPSAAVSHSNTRIQKNETHASVTQYTSGGLFRWRDHGFQPEDEFSKDFEEEDKAAVDADNAARCKLGLSLFSTLDDLRAPSPDPPASVL